MLRWGILSTAKIGVNHVIPAILKSSNGLVQAIASRDLAKAQALAERFQIPTAHGSYEALLADPQVDAIYIPTITSDHTPWTLKCIEAGKAVLCEKPMGMTVAEIEQVQAAASEKGVFVAEAYMVGHHPQWHLVRDLIRDGQIGTLKHVDAAFTYFNDDPKNMRNILAQGGGALRDIGVYPTVTTLFVTEAEPLKVSCYVERDPEFGTDTYADAHVNFDGFDLRFYVSTKLSNRQRVVYHGDEGTIEMTVPFNAGVFGESQVRVTNRNGAEVSTQRFPADEQYKLQIENFGRTMLDGAAYPIDLDLSLQVQRVIDACFESNGGKVVKL